MSIIVVGDLHGNWGSLNALIAKKHPEIVLCCGDFGWWPTMEVQRPVIYGHQRKWILKGLKPGGTKVYWCDGNHEDHLKLKQDGKIHEMYENVFFCSRGSSLDLPDGRRILFAGGADSIDKNLRTPGHDWFSREVINGEDLDRIMTVGEADIVISHTCPTSFFPALHGRSEEKFNDPSCIALDYVLEKFLPEQWFFGHWHWSKQGYDKGCYWHCLDYPKHGGQWWIELK